LIGKSEGSEVILHIMLKVGSRIRSSKIRATIHCL